MLEINTDTLSKEDKLKKSIPNLASKLYTKNKKIQKGLQNEKAHKKTEDEILHIFI